jgi:hypothetical protein
VIVSRELMVEILKDNARPGAGAVGKGLDAYVAVDASRSCRHLGRRLCCRYSRARHARINSSDLDLASPTLGLIKLQLRVIQAALP